MEVLIIFQRRSLKQRKKDGRRYWSKVQTGFRSNLLDIFQQTNGASQPRHAERITETQTNLFRSRSKQVSQNIGYGLAGP
jgi:hypothetical protein